MAKDILMPQMGYDMTEGTIVRWVKKVGDRVAKGDIVAEIETDKATVEIEAFDSGTMLRIVAEPGVTVAVGQPIATLGEAGEVAAPKEAAPVAPKEAASAAPKEAASAAPKEAASAAAKEAPAAAAAKEAPAAKAKEAPAAKAPAPAPAAAPRAATPPAPDGLRASPLARQRAQELGVDLSRVAGTGPAGRIVHADVEAAAQAGAVPAAGTAAEAPAEVAQASAPAAAEAPPPPEGAEDVPLSRLRRTIARRMAESKATAPHFYVSIEVRTGALTAARERLAKGKTKVSLNDLLIRAIALAVKEHPHVNAAYQGDSVRRFKRVDVGIAIATDNGLLSPAVLDCGAKKVQQIATEARDLADRARSGHLKAEEVGGGTITLSNLGMFGVDQFLAILNPPQAMIVSVGAATDRVVSVEGRPAVAKVMTLWAAADHRALDGADVARFLSTLRELVEDGSKLL